MTMTKEKKGDNREFQKVILKACLLDAEYFSAICEVKNIWKDFDRNITLSLEKYYKYYKEYGSEGGIEYLKSEHIGNKEYQDFFSDVISVDLDPLKNREWLEKETIEYIDDLLVKANILESVEVINNPHLDATTKREKIASIMLRLPFSFNKVDREKNVPVDLSFPVEIMSGPARDFTLLYDKYREAPQHFYYMSYLTVLGSVISDRVRMKNSNVQPRLFTLLLGESGISRKSTAAKDAIKLFRECLPEANDFYKTKFNSAEAVINACKIIDESRMGLENDGMGKPYKILLFYDELASIKNKMNISGSDLMTFLTSAYEDNNINHLTKLAGIDVVNIYISLITACTTEQYDGLFGQNALEIGLFNRMFVVPGETTKCIPMYMEPPRDDINVEVSKLTDILEWVGMSKEITISDEALQMWIDWYTDMRFKPCNKQGVMTRLDTIGHRLLLLLAVNEKKDIIDKDVMEKCLKLIEWEKKVRQNRHPIESDDRTVKYQTKFDMVLKEHGEISKADLKRLTRADKQKRGIFEGLVADYIRSGLAREKRIAVEGSRGRPTTVYEYIGEQG